MFSSRWLYALILAIDANFRLKNKCRRIRNDPALGDGWGHWVPEKPYQAYIKKYGYQQEVSVLSLFFKQFNLDIHGLQPNLCDSDLHAIDHANKNASAKYRSTGVGAVVCARHGLVRKNGIGDLQKGERLVGFCFVWQHILTAYSYANMDFILFYTLIGIQILLLILSYDIICQWCRNLRKRMSQFPTFMHLSEVILSSISFVIPKFHIYAHGKSCQFRYSLNLKKWAARINGEDIERWWAHINPASMSTKEMGPGARQDTIDDHAVAWNWRKITGFGMYMCYMCGDYQLMCFC